MSISAPPDSIGAELPLVAKRTKSETLQPLDMQSPGFWITKRSSDPASSSTRANDAAVNYRLAIASVCADDYESAHRHIGLALAAAPHHADLWEHAGLIAAMRAEYVLAEAFYYRAIGIGGSTATVHRNLADCLKLTGRAQEAIQHYKKTLELAPDLHHAIRALARINDELGDADTAAEYWEQAWALDSSAPQDGIDMIAAFVRADRTRQIDDAIAEFRLRFAEQAAQLETLALVLYRSYRFTDAVDVARQGLGIDPTRALLHHYAALALSACGDLTGCLEHGREAVRLLPHSPTMRYYLGYYEIANGQFTEGWARHTAYYALPGNENIVTPTGIPEWRGESLAGREILVVFDQGEGDKIQCIRFADYLHRRGATVDFLTTRSVAQIAASMQCIRTVYADEEPAGKYDYWTHTMKIPEHIGLSVSMLPCIDFPYMTAPVEKAEHWRTRIEAVMSDETRTGNRCVGIVWAGNPDHVWDRYRSVSLDMLRPLFNVPQNTWFPVQKGQCERGSEVFAGEFDIHTLGPSIQDFSDTLAILESLDLLITVDTSVAHLAGAAGRPVWVLVPAYVEWRWLTDRNDSPWYPSMRVFRQRELGNWKPVIEEVRTALLEWQSEMRFQDADQKAVFRRRSS